MFTDILLLLTGVIVGGMNAIAGGGTLVSFPVLLSVGLPALTASATSYVAVLPGQISSAIGYRKFLSKLPKAYLILLIPCAAGAAIGAQLLRHTSFSRFEQIVPFLVLLAILLFVLQPFLSVHLLRHLRSRHKNQVKLLLFGLALFAMTIYGGYFGAGMGFALLALLSFTRQHEIHTLNAMKNIIGITTISVAIISIYSAHLISWQHGLVMAAGNVLGGYFGAHLAQRVPSHVVRVVVVAIGIATAIYLLLRYR